MKLIDMSAWKISSDVLIECKNYSAHNGSRKALILCLYSCKLCGMISIQQLHIRMLKSSYLSYWWTTANCSSPMQSTGSILSALLSLALRLVEKVSITSWGIYALFWFNGTILLRQVLKMIKIGNLAALSSILLSSWQLIKTSWSSTSTSRLLQS